MKARREICGAICLEPEANGDGARTPFNGDLEACASERRVNAAVFWRLSIERTAIPVLLLAGLPTKGGRRKRGEFDQIKRMTGTG